MHGTASQRSSTMLDIQEVWQHTTCHRFLIESCSRSESSSQSMLAFGVSSYLLSCAFAIYTSGIMSNVHVSTGTTTDKAIILSSGSRFKGPYHLSTLNTPSRNINVFMLAIHIHQLQLHRPQKICLKHSPLVPFG